MIYLLDTNVCIAAMRGNPQVLARLLACSPNDCGVSTVCLYELIAGVDRCQHPEREMKKVEALVAPLHILPFDEFAAARTAGIRHRLEMKGEIIGPYDLMIAGQAIALDVTLVTHNTREFQRVDGLKLEDWQSA